MARNTARNTSGGMVLRGLAQGLVGAIVAPVAIIAFAATIVSGNHSDGVAIAHLCIGCLSPFIVLGALGAYSEDKGASACTMLFNFCLWLACLIAIFAASESRAQFNAQNAAYNDPDNPNSNKLPQNPYVGLLIFDILEIVLSLILAIPC